MTREEAKKEIEKVFEPAFANYIITALTGGVTVTEFADRCRECGREKILDKISAEIEAKCCITVGKENDGAITLHDVFEIIDKYRTESEDKHGRYKEDSKVRKCRRASYGDEDYR